MKYKVGDKVRIRSKEWHDEYKDEHGEIRGAFFDKERAELCGSIQTIAGSAILSSGIIIYAIEDSYKFIGEEAIEGLMEEENKFGTALNPIEPKSNANCLTRERVDELATKIDKELPSGNQNVWELPDDYQFVDENGNVINASKIFLEKKKLKYPKTYEECCKVLNLPVRDLDILDNMLDTTEIIYNKNLDRLLNSFRKLLICRDAYWKLYGEEMGLGKPWELSIGTPIYYIYYNRTLNTIKKDYADDIQGNVILAFPTAEMRDAFYENFKKEIEECKELL